MNWINIIMISLVSSAITGGIITLLWMAVSRISASVGNARYLYLLLRGAVFGYVLPFLFMLAYNMRRMYRGYTDSLILTNRPLRVFLYGLVVLWGLGVLAQIGRQIQYWRMFRQIKLSCVPAPEKYRTILERVCEELHIFRPIRMVVGYGVVSPFIYGAFRPCIFLPDMDFEEEDLEIILYHEVVHYKQNDVFWKPIFGIIYFLYWFSPLAKHQWKLTKRWAEASNDARCCEEKVSKKKYFSLLLEMSSSMEYMDSLGFVSMWREEENELKWRVRCMGRMKSRTVTARTSVALVLAMVLTGTGLTAGDVYLLNVLYGKTYWLTAEAKYASKWREADFEKQQKKLMDYKVLGDEILAPQKSIEGEKETHAFSWQISGYETCATNQFILEPDDGVIVMLSGDLRYTEIAVGIVDDEGNAEYIEEKDILSYTFKASRKENYRIFIKNLNEQDITLAGYYVK